LKCTFSNGAFQHIRGDLSGEGSAKETGAEDIYSAGEKAISTHGVNAETVGKV